MVKINMPELLFPTFSNVYYCLSATSALLEKPPSVNNEAIPTVTAGFQNFQYSTYGYLAVHEKRRKSYFSWPINKHPIQHFSTFLIVMQRVMFQCTIQMFSVII